MATRKEIATLVINLETRLDKLEAGMRKAETRGTQAAAKVEKAFKNMMTAAVGAFAVDRILRFGAEMIELGNKIKGIERAFKRLDSGNLLKRLRQATKGLIDDMQLMQSAVFAEKFNIPMDVLVKGMEFAGLTAIETGQDFNYMMESFVTGTARQSVMILDNLGISSKALSDEIKITGDFMTALGNIMDRQLTKMREGMDETILKTKQLNTQLENERQVLAVGIADAWNKALNAASKYFLNGIKHMGAFLELLGAFFKDGVTFGEAFEDYTLKLARISGITVGINNEMSLARDLTSAINKKYKEIIISKLKEKKVVTETTGELKKQLAIIHDAIQLGGQRPKAGAATAGTTGFDYSALVTGKVTEPPKPIIDTDNIDYAQSNLNSMVGLSSQIAANFSLAGNTFVAQLAQAIDLATSISNVILTVASLFTNISGFGIGGLLGLIGLKEGGNIAHRGSHIDVTPIPKFATGVDSFTVPPGYQNDAFNFRVSSGEEVNVRPVGMVSKTEKLLKQLSDQVAGNTLSISKAILDQGGGATVKVYLDKKVIATAVQGELNRMGKGKRNLSEIL